ncbi:MAG: Ppx/GppA family phosphatase [Microthrixaceae bacterium]|nr:Ppx/GppA family phosphatase [Microthrixaceae bacterium]
MATRDSHADQPDVIAAIDIGTNSIHMVIARVVAGGRLEVVTREKDMVRLGSGVGEMKELSPEAMDRGVAALKRCAILAESFGAPVRAVATSAMREASNSKEFRRRARDEAGIDVDVISGTEEARLIYLGVLQALPVFDDSIVLVDVGGGSTEVLFGQSGSVEHVRSVKLGALRMTNKFFPDGNVLEKSVSKCRKHVRSKVASLVYESIGIERSVAVVCSGTALTLAAMAIQRRGGESPMKLNAETFTVTELSALVEELAAAPDLDSRRMVPGLDSSRVDIILGGAIVLEQVCIALGLTELTVSEYALREGALLDAMQRLGVAGADELAGLRRSSVFHLMGLCDDDPDHSIQIARLSTMLHDALCSRLGLSNESRELLEAAALLANVGLFIAHSAHHKHSYYVIRNSEHLMGFTDREIEIIAQTARYHRKSAPSEKHAEFAALSPADQQLVRSLASMLRVVIGMDRNHDGRVAAVKVVAEQDSVTLGLVPADSRELDLEVYSTSDRSLSLSDCLGVPVAVEVAPRDATG